MVTRCPRERKTSRVTRTSRATPPTCGRYVLVNIEMIKECYARFRLGIGVHIRIWSRFRRHTMDPSMEPMNQIETPF